MIKELKSFFSRKKAAAPLPPKPSRQEIAELMHGQSLSGYADNVIKVIYSDNNEKRVVFFRSKRGFCYYVVEYLMEFDDEEWAYIAGKPDALPAMWAEPVTTSARSVFGTEQEAWEDFIASPEYKNGFNEKTVS